MKKQQKQSEAKAYRINKVDSFTFQLVERDGDEEKVIYSEILPLVLDRAMDVMREGSGL